MNGDRGQTEALDTVMDGAGEPRIRLLIADDHAFSRKALRTLFSTWPAVELAGEAQDGGEAVELVGLMQPDVVLMDLQMPVCDGLEAIRCIKYRWPQVRIIALTVHAASRASALAAGADGFVVKGCRLEELLSTIRAIGASQPRQETNAAERAGGPLLLRIAAAGP